MLFLDLASNRRRTPTRRALRADFCNGRLPVRWAGSAAVLLFLVEGTAWAIPSPDLIVNLFASTAQLFALATVVLGTWLFGGGRRRRSGSGGSGFYKYAFFVSAAACVVFGAGWALYAAEVADVRNKRLEANLTRSSKEDGKKIADVSLKELSFSDQLVRGDGLATEALAGRIASGERLQLLDIRESEEFEMGRVPGARHVRFPDLMSDPRRFAEPDVPILLLCFNGNRSSELCAHLSSLGFDCSFIVGGAEKWVAEERPLEMAENRSPDELRQIAGYPNKDVLLDTPDVMALLEERPDVLFVDVRYPGEFESGHLPGAINIPMRKLTTPELDAALAALPKRPVIAPCYDRRSSFFALTLGLRLHRRGYEYLGRYTVPESFVTPPKDKPHIAAWKEARAKKSLLGLAAEPLGVVFASLHGSLGSFALATLLLVLLVRLVVLPLTWKGDRDRLTQQKLAPRLAELKRRHASDPALVSRTTLGILREHRVRPLFAFVGTLAQLFLFTLFFSVVDAASKGSSESFLWVPKIGESDPFFVLPALFGALLGVQILLSGKATLWRIAIAGACAVGLSVLVLGLNAGTNLYLCANLVLLVAQTAIARAWFERGRTVDAGRIAARHAGSAAVPLAVAQHVAGTGNKAARLGRLITAGLPVPAGFAVQSDAIEAARREGAWLAADRRSIERAHATLGSSRVAVRSSGVNEDGGERSYAGVFESLLDVEPERLFLALEKVGDSLVSARSQSYSAEDGAEQGGIVVQAMVPAEYAGVLFTEHPGESGAALVELVAGLGDGLVSGRAAPRAYRLGRVTGRLLDGAAPPIDLAPLFALGREIEALFGRPQDIEWAFAGGRFSILQARDVTRLARDGVDGRAIRERERGRVLDLVARSARGEIEANVIVLAQTELSELLPRPTPFSLALMESMWAYDGPTDLACRNLGLAYEVDPDSPPWTVGVFGALYVSKLEEKRRLGRGPGALASFRLTRAADEIERSYREGWLAKHLEQARLRAVIDLAKLEQGELVDLLGSSLRRFLTETYVQAETVNLAAEFYFKAALRGLERKGLDPALHLGRPPESVVHLAFERLAVAARGTHDFGAFLELFGHRAAQDYELAEPRYGEDPARVRALAALSASSRGTTTHAPAPEIERRVLALAVDRARRWQTLKEEAKHHALHDLAFVRRIVLELGRRTGVGDGLFQLTPEEIRTLPGKAVLEERIRIRHEESEAQAELRLPSALSIAMLEELDVEHAGEVLRPVRSVHGALRGTRVSGSGEVVGRVRVLRRAEEIARFEKGEILVARFTDPAWMPAFPLAGGIVTEVGGWLSHAAITAREYGVPATVGVEGALDALREGDLVRLHADGIVEPVAERRDEPRVAVSTGVELHLRSGTRSARLSDLSSRGALLEIEGTLEIGSEIEIGLAGGALALEATVVRNGVTGVYGVRFSRTIDVDVEGALRSTGGRVHETDG